MSRPLRIEFPGAIYHVTSRGDRREPIFEDESDRAALLGVLEEGMQCDDRGQACKGVGVRPARCTFRGFVRAPFCPQRST